MIITKHGNKLKTFICDECDCEWKISPIDIKERNYYVVLDDKWDSDNFKKGINIVGLSNVPNVDI